MQVRELLAFFHKQGSALGYKLERLLLHIHGVNATRHSKNDTFQWRNYIRIPNKSKSEQFLNTLSDKLS